MIIGISGKLGSGKDTLCAFLIAALAAKGITAVRRSWADALKEESAECVSDCENYTDLMTFLEQNNCGYADRIVEEIWRGREDECLSGQYTNVLAEMHNPDLKWRYRSLNQWWGTEYRREQFDQAYWTKKVIEFARARPGTDVLPADTRFPNEAEACDHLIRVERPSLDLSLPEYQHPSETLLDDYPFTHIIVNDQDINHLRQEAQRLADILA